MLAGGDAAGVARYPDSLAVMSCNFAKSSQSLMLIIGCVRLARSTFSCPMRAQVRPLRHVVAGQGEVARFSVSEPLAPLAPLPGLT